MKLVVNSGPSIQQDLRQSSNLKETWQLFAITVTIVTLAEVVLRRGFLARRSAYLVQVGQRLKC